MKIGFLKGALALALVNQVATAAPQLHPFAEQWNIVTSAFGSTFVGLTGQQNLIPLPAALVFVPGLGYIAQAPEINEFAVRISPHSLRNCVPAVSGSSKNFTGVIAPQVGITTTQYTGMEDSASRPGWKNHKFSVNGGRALAVQAFSIVFQPVGSHAAQCQYEVLYRNTERPLVPGPTPFPAPGPTASAAPAAAPLALSPASALQAAPQTAGAAAGFGQGFFPVGQNITTETK